MKTKYKTNRHSVYLLQYHLILVVKYRRKVITDEICERLREIFENIGDGYDIDVIEFAHDGDHLHILFEAAPKTNLLTFINAYKSASSRVIKREFAEITKQLWDEYFWSRSYFLATTGGVTLEILKNYVENQGIEDNRPKKHYKKRTTQCK